jgi:hypothetical protein
MGLVAYQSFACMGYSVAFELLDIVHAISMFKIKPIKCTHDTLISIMHSISLFPLHHMFFKFPVAFWKVESLKSKPIKTFPQHLIVHPLL